MNNQPPPRPRALFPGVRPLFALAGTLMLLSLVFAGRASLVEGAGAAGASRAAEADARGKGAKPSLSDEYGKLPLAFEENRGQTDRRVRFVSRGDGYALFLTGSEAVLRLRGDCARRPGEARTTGDGGSRANHEGDAEGDLPCAPGGEEEAVLRLGLAGARRGVRVSGVGRLAGESNYFVGAARGWRTRVPQFARVVYEGVYPGVDLVYYGNRRQLEYDFVVAPGADARRIALKFDGAESARVDERGDLVLRVAGREVIQRKPFAYQEVGGERREVAARYVLPDSPKSGRGTRGTFEVGFELGAYDRARTLVIDPVLVYSTYVGGTGFEEGVAVAVDAAGSAYLTGNTGSLDFPVVGGVQPQAGDEFSDAYVLKLNPAGTAVVYATYLGGTGSDAGNGIAVDSQGSAYVAGFTVSGNFPTTPGAAQTSPGGTGDGFLTKLDPSGAAIVYSTFVGGNNSDTISSVAVDAAGSAYFVGRTESTVFGMPGVPPLVRGGHPVYQSTDAAANWGGSANGLAATSVNALAADPSNASVLYAGAPGGVFKSTDGGASWALTGQASPATAPLSVLSVAVDPNNPNVVYAATVAGGLLYKSTDGGNLYEVKSNGITASSVNVVIAVPTGQGATTLYAGAASGGVYKSTDNAETWTRASVGLSTFFATINELVYDPSNPNVLYAGTNNAGVFKTTNGGASWFTVTSGLTLSSARITGLALDPANPLTLYAATSSSFDVVYKTTNGGGTWSASSNGLRIPAGLGQFTFPTINALSISPAAPATVYASASNGGIFRSTDGGANWVMPNTGLRNTAALSVLAHPASASTVLAGFNIGGDAFAGKLNAAGSQPVYFRHLAGSDNDSASTVVVDAGGNAYFVGTTTSADFPVANAFRPAKNTVATDAFLTKLSPDGQTLVYSTYLGGSAADSGRSVAVNAQGQAHVTGQTTSNDFPLVTPIDSVPISNTEAFVTKFNASGGALLFSTFLGGDGPDQGAGIAVDARDNIYVTGNTGGPNSLLLIEPTQATYGGGPSDAFLVRYNLGAGQMDFATYLGGASSDTANDIAVDAAGSVYVVGSTSSGNFPTANPVRPSLGGDQDAFVSKFSVNADLAITKRDSRDPVMVNNTLAYTLVVTNHGPDAASNVRVTDALPAGVTFVSATPSQGACSGTTTVTCDLGRIADGEAEGVVIVVTPTAVGTIGNTAAVTSDTPDLDLSDNSSTQETRVSDLPSIAGRITTVTTGQFGGQTVPLAGVTVALSGSATATAVTDAEGRYQFADLATPGNYTVTPSRAGFVFNPGSQTFGQLAADVTADFVAVGCTFTITPSNQSFTAGGGAGTVNVTASDPRCPRTATSNAPWITVTSGAAANGGGTIGFAVAATNTSRSGAINIAGQVFTVWQELSPCGEASFRAAPPIAGAPGAFEALDADFNNDGKPDLAFATPGGGAGGNAVTLMLNDGGGQFHVSASFGVAGFGMRSIASGDFNGDGKRDLAVVVSTGCCSNGTVALLPGDGAGHFGLATNFTVGQNPSDAAAGDFNGDGRADLAVTHEQTGNLSVLLGHAANGLSPAATVGAQNSMPQARFVVAADFNKDGKPDLAVLAAFGIYFLQGDGAGNFNVPATRSQAGVFEQFGLAAGDVNGDGSPDLAVAGNNLTVLFGDGAGAFAAPATLIPGRISRAVIIRDFNGDGRGDVAAAGADGVSVFVAAPANAFLPARSYVVGISPRPLAAGDFDGDGRPDLVSADGGGLAPVNPTAFLMRGDGAGNFAAARAYAAPSSPLETAPADFNGDGRPDLLVVSTSSASYLPAAGAPGEFGAPVNIADAGGGNGGFTRTFSVADFNRDGRPDLALLVTTSVGPSESGVRVFINDGAGALTQASETRLEDFNNTALFADFNGDGNPDLVSTAQPVWTLVVRPGNGAGGFGAPVVVSPALGQISRLAAGDFNGDGRLDIVAGAGANSSCNATGSSRIAVLLGDGAGAFAAPVFTTLNGGFVENVPVQDLNGDGRSDLVAADCFLHLRVLSARGDGSFNVGPGFGTGSFPTPQRLALGDLNGDGRPDLVMTEGDDTTEANRVTVFLGNGAGSFAPSLIFNAGVAPAGLALADLDANGRNDLAFASLAGSHVSVYLNSCPVPAAASVQFAAATFAATEGTDRSVLVTVTRTGDTTGETTVGYATADGSASERRDYTAALGRLRFAADETTKTFEVVITDDRFQEPAETFSLSLSEPTGAALGTQATAVVTVNSDDAANGPSPVKDASFETEFFVRQHYADFLNRVPDAGGLAFWVGGIESCGADQQCREVKKVDTSAAFFLSIEFQETGFLAYRAHKAAFGNLAGRPVPVRLRDFLSDSRQIGDGVVVGATGWPEKLEANKAAYFNAFVARPAFLALYPQTMTAAEFVDALFTRAGIQPTQAERQAALNAYGAGGAAGRAAALRSVAESQTLKAAETNRAFVLMQYFGYLRRNPDDPQDTNFDGFFFWLQKLEQFDGNYVAAEMVKAFIQSIEYGDRFGQ